MLGSNLLRPVVGKYGLLRYLLLVAQVVLVITSFSVITECKATPLTGPDLCLLHIGRSDEHEHVHPQLVAVLPLTVGQEVFPFTDLYAHPNLLPVSTLLDLIKPPPRLS